MSSTEKSAESAERTLFRRHDRLYGDHRFVYPVISRRSRGVSIGVNLNPDKVCNFDCIYCQVDRRSEAETRFVETMPLEQELRRVTDEVISCRLFEHPAFRQTPDHLRRLNDIAFSGDGEPTTFRNFDEIIALAASVRRESCPQDVRLVLITNASMFHRDHVQRGLQLLDDNNGQIWAKLDAGTEDYYRLIDRSAIPFQRILDNITRAARVRPIVIQSLFMNVDGSPPTDSEIMAYVHRLRDIRTVGGHLELVQVYTVARPPAESFVTPLSKSTLDEIADRIHQEVGVTAEVFV